MPTSPSAVSVAEDAPRHRRRNLRRFSNHPRERQRSHHRSHTSNGDDTARPHRRQLTRQRYPPPHLSQSSANGAYQLPSVGGAHTSRAPSRPRDGHLRAYLRAQHLTNARPPPLQQQQSSSVFPSTSPTTTTTPTRTSARTTPQLQQQQQQEQQPPAALPSTLHYRCEAGGGYVVSGYAHGAIAMGTAVVHGGQQLPLSPSLLEIALPPELNAATTGEDVGDFDDDHRSQVDDVVGSVKLPSRRGRSSRRQSIAASRSPLAANKSQSHNAILGFSTRNHQGEEEVLMNLSSSAMTLPSSITSPQQFLSPAGEVYLLPQQHRQLQQQQQQQQQQQLPASTGTFPQPFLASSIMDAADVLSGATNNTSGVMYTLTSMSSIHSRSSEESESTNNSVNSSDDDDDDDEHDDEGGLEPRARRGSVVATLEEGGGIILSDSFLRLHPTSPLATRCHESQNASLRNSPRLLHGNTQQQRLLSPHLIHTRVGRSWLTSPVEARTSTLDDVAGERPAHEGFMAEPTTPRTHFVPYPSNATTPAATPLLTSPLGLAAAHTPIVGAASSAAFSLGRSTLSRRSSGRGVPHTPMDTNNSSVTTTSAGVVPMLMDAVVLEVFDERGGANRRGGRERSASRPVPQLTSPRTPSSVRGGGGGGIDDAKHAAAYMMEVAQQQRPMFRRKTSAEAYGRGMYFQLLDEDAPTTLMLDAHQNMDDEEATATTPTVKATTSPHPVRRATTPTHDHCLLSPSLHLRGTRLENSIMHGSTWMDQ